MPIGWELAGNCKLLKVFSNVEVGLCFEMFVTCAINVTRRHRNPLDQHNGSVCLTSQPKSHGSVDFTDW